MKNRNMELTMEMTTKERLRFEHDWKADMESRKDDDFVTSRDYNNPFQGGFELPKWQF